IAMNALVSDELAPDLFVSASHHLLQLLFTGAEAFLVPAQVKMCALPQPLAEAFLVGGNGTGQRGLRVVLMEHTIHVLKHTVLARLLQINLVEEVVLEAALGEHQPAATAALTVRQ